jgi:hypothetical protein
VTVRVRAALTYDREQSVTDGVVGESGDLMIVATAPDDQITLAGDTDLDVGTRSFGQALGAVEVEFDPATVHLASSNEGGAPRSAAGAAAV